MTEKETIWYNFGYYMYMYHLLTMTRWWGYGGCVLARLRLVICGKKLTLARARDDSVIRTEYLQVLQQRTMSRIIQLLSIKKYA